MCHLPQRRGHRSSKPSGAQPSGALSDQDQPQHDPDPPYYREVALSEKGRQELRRRGPSSMLPLSSVIKDALDKFEQDFQAANLPEGKYIKPPPSTTKWYKVGQPCYEEKLQELNTVLLLNPLGLLWARFPYQFLRNWNTKLGKISPRSTLLLPLPRLYLLAVLLLKIVNIA